MSTLTVSPARSLNLTRLALNIQPVAVTGLAFVWLYLVLLVRSQFVLHILVGLPILFYAVLLIRNRRLPAATHLDWWTAAIILAAAASVLSSVDPRVSVEAAVSRASAILIFYIVYDWRRLELTFVARLFVLVGILVGVLALFDVIDRYREWLDFARTTGGGIAVRDLVPEGTIRTGVIFWHPNALAKFLNIMLPLAVVMFFYPSARNDRLFASAAILLGTFALFFTGSRGGWLAAMAWTFVLYVLADWGKISLGSPLRLMEKLNPSRGWLLAAATTFVVALVGASALLATAGSDWLFRATISDRVSAAAIGWDIFRDHMLFGAGPNTYMLLYEEYRGDFDKLLSNPHNLYFGMLAEVGIVGSLVVAGGLAVLFRSLYGAYRQTHAALKPYVAAVVAILCAALVGGLSDFPLTWNTQLIPLALLLAPALRSVPLASSISWATKLRLRTLPRVFALALVPLVLGVWLISDGARSDYQQSLGARNPVVLTAEHLDAAERAAQQDPQFWPYQLNAGIMQIRFVMEQEHWPYTYGDMETQVDLPSAALEHLEKADQVAPNNSLINANLAMAYRMEGDRDAAVAAARSSIALAPLDPYIYALAGATLEWAGLTDEAMEAYGAAIQVDPSLVQAPFWTSRPDSIRHGAIAASGVGSCNLAFYGAIYGLYREDLPGYISACRQEFNQDPSASHRAHLAIALSQVGAETESIALLAEVEASQAEASSDLVLAQALLRADDDIAGVRRILLSLARTGNKDARALLVSSYSGENSFGIDTPLTGTDLWLPDSVIPLAGNLAKGVTSIEDLAQHGDSARLFNYGTSRGVPSILMLPGDWVGMASPQRLIGINALKERRASSSDQTCASLVPCLVIWSNL